MNFTGVRCLPWWGAWRTHGRVVLRLSRRLAEQLDGTACQVFAVDRQWPSLKEYVLVDPDTQQVAGFRRGADNLWVLHDMNQDAAMQAASVGCSVPLEQVFQCMVPDAET